MSTEIDSSEKTVVNVAECQKSGIPVLPPNINFSGIDFVVEFQDDGSPAVRFGLAAVKGVGKAALESVIANRNERDDNHFPTLDAFCDSIDWTSGNKKMIESLVKAGVLDEYGHRAQVLVGMEQLASSAQKRQRAKNRGQMDMFGQLIVEADEENSGTVLPDIAEADQKQVLEWEKEVLGIYLSSHPLKEIIGSELPSGFHTVASIVGMASNQTVRLIGMVKNVRRVTTKTNKTMAVMEVEDLTGSTEVVVFPKKYEEFGALLEPDAILVVEGKVDERGDQNQLLLESLSATIPGKITRAPVVDTVMVNVRLTGDQWSDVALLQQLDEVTTEYVGEHPLELLVRIGDQVRPFRSRSKRVEWSPASIHAIEAITGPKSVQRRQQVA